MPIYSLEGTPGAGKTLYTVQKIIPDFLRIRDFRGELVPRHIYTNIAGFKPWLLCAWLGLPYEAITEYFHVLGQAVDENGRAYEDKDLVRWWMFRPETIEWVETQNSARQVERVPDFSKAERIEKNALVIIDELQNYYGSRDFGTNYCKRAIDYLTTNRHYGWTLWWMTTNVEQVEVTFRRNTEQVYFLEKKENYGSSSSASVKKYEGWLSGDKANTPPFAVDSFHYDKKYFAAYKSYEDGVQGEKRYKTNVFLHHKGFMVMAVLLVVCIVLAIFNNPLTATKKAAAIANKTPAATAQQQAARPVRASFSGTTGRAAVDSSADCAVNYFVVKGAPWVILKNGEKRKVKEGAVYADCH